MAALLAHNAQLRALHATLQVLDPQMADALHAHLHAAETADTVLRECGIQMATLHTAMIAAGRDGSQPLALRARIDALITPPAMALPISQNTGD